MTNHIESLERARGWCGSPLAKRATAEAVEKVAVVVVFGYFCFNVVPELVGGGDCNLVLLLTEGFAVGLLLWHRPAKEVSRRSGDWVLALSASFLPALIDPITIANPETTFLPISLMLFGFCLQIAAKLFLWRSFGILPANRGVRTTGPYAFLRHPMYTGYLITHAGFLLAYPLAWNLALYALTNALQVRRLLIEEAILRSDPNYSAYRRRVRWRMLPGVF